MHGVIMLHSARYGTILLAIVLARTQRHTHHTALTAPRDIHKYTSLYVLSHYQRRNITRALNSTSSLKQRKQCTHEAMQPRLHGMATADLLHCQVLWTFSIYLEAVAIIPQLVLLQRTQNIDNLTGNYVFLLGCAALRERA